MAETMSSLGGPESTVFSPDPKPIGAFIEYTIKPIIEEANELLDRMGESGLHTKDILNQAIKLYLIDIAGRLIVNVLCTGMICLTILYCLRSAK